MNVNINHPSFLLFLDQVTNNILSNISVANYFSLSPDKKLNLQYIVFRLMKTSVKVKATMSDSELRGFVTVLWKKNEEIENYEFAAILNEIIKNFDSIHEYTQPKKRSVKIENKN